MTIRRGRPTFFKMTEKSKQSIRDSKLGYKHLTATKERITAGIKKQHDVGAPIDILMTVDLEKCGKSKNKYGYIDVNIPNPIVGAPTYKQRYHVALLEQFLRRKLYEDEQVHHWADKDNNNIKLLTLCKNYKEHRRLDIAKANMRKELFGEKKVKKRRRK